MTANALRKQTRAQKPVQKAVAWTFILILLAGCTDIPRQQGFDTVETAVTEAWQFKPAWPESDAQRLLLRQQTIKLLKDPVTPESAVRVALMNSPLVRAIYEDLNISYAQVVQAGLIANPILEGKVKVPLESGGVGFEMGLAQNFIDILYIPIRKKVAQSEFESVKPRVAAAVTAFAAKVELQTIMLQARQEAAQHRREALDVADGLEAFARELYKAGNITPQLHAAWMLRAAHIRDASQESLHRLAIATEAYLGMLGVGDPQSPVSFAPASQPVSISNPERLIEEALNNSLSLRAARAHGTAESVLLKAHRDTRLIPEGELGIEAERGSDGDWSLGPIFALPIPLFDQGQAKIAGSYARAMKAAALAEHVEVMLKAQARSIKIELARAEQHLRLAQDQIAPMASENMNQTLREYNAMLTGANTLLEARLQEIQARESLALARGRLAVARRRAQLIAIGIPLDSQMQSPADASDTLASSNANISNNFIEGH
jgi:cobalt-zinc-cadmium efflux system outer membrane protein